MTGVISALFAPFAVVANFLVFFAILLNPYLRSPSCLLIGCLAWSDLLVSLIVQPTYVAYRFREIRFGYVNCATRRLYATVFYICYCVSFLTLSAISFERYLALRLHLRYKGLVTGKRVLLVAILMWVLNIALTSLQWARINIIARGIHAPVFLVCFAVDRGNFTVKDSSNCASTLPSNSATATSLVR